MKTSVCMATYDGAEYIRPQVASILKQLHPDDELIVVDDNSEDSTKDIIQDLHDPRIQLFTNPTNLGAPKTFERALRIARGELIFLSDQDDVWLENKVLLVTNQLMTQGADLVVHDAIVVDGDEVLSNSLFALRGSSKGILRNLVSNTYTGCCMAFKTGILKRVLPIPSRRGIWHDAWIGILADFYRYKVSFLPIPLMLFRRHPDNASTLRTRNVQAVLQDRLALSSALALHVATNRIAHENRAV